MTKPAVKPAGKPVAGRSGKPATVRTAAVVKAATRSTPATKPVAKSGAVAVVKSTQKPLVAKVAPKPAAASPVKSVAPVKPVLNGKAKPATAIKPANGVAVHATANGSIGGTANGAANGAVNGEPAKPAGKPMLMQGPIASKSLTKKGTFAIFKTPLPAPKPVKRRVERIEPQFVVIQPPVAQVATSEKAVKNRAGLNQRDLDFFRDLLLSKRRELMGDMSSMEREALRESNANLSNLPVHMADQGTDAYEQEFTLGLVEKDRGLLREINDALAKIQNGSYAICEGTGEPIGRPRLEAQPWARHSIEYARVLEKRKMVFRR